MQNSELYTVMEEQYFGVNMQEKDEIESLPELLRNVRTFVDVGASLGQYAFFANRILMDSRIYCIEADPVRVSRLKELASAWEERSSNTIAVINAAAAETNGKLSFFRTNANVSGGLFVHGCGGAAGDKHVQWIQLEVDCVTLDSLFKELDPDLIKIDVEGAEYRVLEGASRILAKGTCRFLVEVHPWGDKSARKKPSDVFTLFARFGYDFKRTHRHWLFEKSQHGFTTTLRSKLIGIVIDSVWLRAAGRRYVQVIHALRRRRPAHARTSSREGMVG
jgi:FkbM family methyltransferase